MRVGDEDIDFGLVMGEERMDVGLVNDTSSLALWKDKVGKADKAKVGIEGEPAVHVSSCR